MKTNLYIFTIVIAFFSFFSCADDPGSIGDVLIPEGDKLSNKVISSLVEGYDQNFESYEKDSLYYGSSSRLLLGNYRNLKSDLFLKFFINIDDSIKNLIDSSKASLNSSWIEMYPNYWIGDSTILDFSVNRINLDWNPIQTSEDTLNDIYSSKGPDVIVPSSISVQDSIIKFEINDELVNNWITDSFDKENEEYFGILLEPTTNTGIVGFQGLTNFQTHKYITLFMVINKEGNDLDTIKATPNLDMHVVSGQKLEDPSGSIILQSSLGVRGKLKFDLSTVPADIIINKATMDLFIDENNSEVGTISTDTIAIGLYDDFESASLSTSIGQYPLIKSNNKYSGDIRQFIQLWINGEKNEGLEVKLSDENRSASKISVFSSTNSVDSLKPRLTIYYTTK